MSTISLWIQLVLSIPFLLCIISNAFILKTGKYSEDEKKQRKKRESMGDNSDPNVFLVVNMLLLALLVVAPLLATSIILTGWSTEVTDKTIR